MAIRKILVAHDFSEAATRALRFAAGLARTSEATLAIVYVRADIYDGRGDPSLSLPGTLPGHAERYMHFLETELQRVADQVLAEPRPPFTCHVLRGDPVKHIAELAQQLGADLICVGATGKGAVQRVMLGSVSQLLLRTATIPVLLVP